MTHYKKRIISHPAFVDAQRFGKRAAHAVLAASAASHDSTNALIFKREQVHPGESPVHEDDHFIGYRASCCASISARPDCW